MVLEKKLKMGESYRWIDRQTNVHVQTERRQTKCDQKSLVELLVKVITKRKIIYKVE